MKDGGDGGTIIEVRIGFIGGGSHLHTYISMECNHRDIISTVSDWIRLVRSLLGWGLERIPNNKKEASIEVILSGKPTSRMMRENVGPTIRFDVSSSLASGASTAGPRRDRIVSLLKISLTKQQFGINAESGLCHWELATQ